jgi:predicted nucleotidyltransferase
MALPYPHQENFGKRGRVSTTSRMLAEREAYIVAEEEVTGQPSTWERVYELIQYNVRSCPHKSDWC